MSDEAAARAPSAPVEKRACRWWEPHRWTAWSTPELGRMVSGGAVLREDVQIQRRHCERCGQVELRHAS